LSSAAKVVAVIETWLGLRRRVSSLCRASNSCKKVWYSGSVAAGGLLMAATGPAGRGAVVFSVVLRVKAPVECIKGRNSL